MQSHRTWSFKTPRRITLEGQRQSIELTCDAAGFAGAWVVRPEGRAVACRPDLNAAQDVAPTLAARAPAP